MKKFIKLMSLMVVLSISFVGMATNGIIAKKAKNITISDSNANVMELASVNTVMNIDVIEFDVVDVLVNEDLYLSYDTLMNGESLYLSNLNAIRYKEVVNHSLRTYERSNYANLYTGNKTKGTSRRIDKKWVTKGSLNLNV